MLKVTSDIIFDSTSTLEMKVESFHCIVRFILQLSPLYTAHFG